jgi:hypothetical protein
MCTIFLMAPVLWALAAGPAGAAQKLPFSDGHWELTGEKTAVETRDGREVLRVETGWAYRRDVRLEDGTIDFDVQVTRRRSFVYVAFRMVADGENEEFYLRPHKSGLPDSVQYAPVWQGASAWQLHHGPGATAAVVFEPGAWTHVRVVLQGRHAALFVGDLDRPALVVPHLAREPKPGYIALRGLLPANTPGDGPIARFSDVVIRPGVVAYDFSSLPARAPMDEPGAVHAWAVSRAFPPSREPRVELPDAAILGPLERLETEPSGLLELHRLVKLPEGSRAAEAMARVHVRAASATTRAFDLGFSDRVTVFLNGRPLFSGDASYSFDAPRRDGLIGYDQARLYLPLEQGDNVLELAVADSFGGWGLMGRFPEPEGLQVEAR